MPNLPTDWIMTVLDPIGVVVGLVIAVPVIWTWIDVVFGERRRKRRWFREARNRAGQRPAILIIDLLIDKDIRSAVEHYRQTHDALAAIPDDRVITIARGRRLSADDMPDLARDIRAAAGKLIAAGADTVHYFHAGPAAVAAIVGAELGNAHRVMVYQHDPDGYHNFGLLRTGL